MIVQSRAIPLTIRPWSRTSHIVTWLTEDFGKITTPVKGACRPKSAFLGQYDLFYTCDLHFYRRDHDGMHAIRECAPLELRETLRDNWRAVAAAGYLADLISRTAVTSTESRDLFAAWADTLDRLPQSQDLHLLMLWFELRLLKSLGLQPDLTICPECHPQEQPWLRFSPASGRFCCPHLAQRSDGEVTLSVHRRVRNLAKWLLQSPIPPAPRLKMPENEKKIAENENPLLGLSRFLGIFIKFHLDAPSVVRRVAWEMTEKTPSPSAAT
ncbi:MAG: DNA repair protein RecO [Kiritimatiellae bacterium]|nr:DNA repair protein RecO [Kiritimatiellia bacterium]